MNRADDSTFGVPTLSEEVSRSHAVAADFIPSLDHPSVTTTSPTSRFPHEVTLPPEHPNARELEALGLAMLQSSLLAVVVHQDSRIRMANQAAARLFGYDDPCELVGREVFDALCSPDERAGLRARTQALYSGHAQPTLARWKGLSRTSAELWVQSTARVIPWEGRDAVVVLLHDVTEEQFALVSWRERDALLRAIADQTEDVIFVKDCDSRILYINPAGLRAIGLPASQVVGHTDPEFVPDPDIAAAFRVTDLKVIKTRQTLMVEEEFVTPDGQRRLFLTRKTPRLNAAGEVIGIVGVTRNITEERRLQQEILQIAENENRRIGQDLHDGAGQQLTAMSYMAEALRAELQEQSRPEAELAQRLVDTVRRTQSMIRAFSRGLVPVEIAAEGLRYALERLAESSMAASGIPCRFECPYSVRIADSHVMTQLYRIAQEAVTNALRHADARNITIELHAEVSRLTLSISDDGVGPPPPDTNSSGLGLRIMRYRAGLIRASLDIRAAIPHGTCVICTLPHVSTGD